MFKIFKKKFPSFVWDHQNNFLAAVRKFPHLNPRAIIVKGVLYGVCLLFYVKRRGGAGGGEAFIFFFLLDYSKYHPQT